MGESQHEDVHAVVAVVEQRQHPPVLDPTQRQLAEPAGQHDRRRAVPAPAVFREAPRLPGGDVEQAVLRHPGEDEALVALEARGERVDVPAVAFPGEHLEVAVEVVGGPPDPGRPPGDAVVERAVHLGPPHVAQLAAHHDVQVHHVADGDQVGGQHGGDPVAPARPTGARRGGGSARPGPRARPARPSPSSAGRRRSTPGSANRTTGARQPGPPTVASANVSPNTDTSRPSGATAVAPRSVPPTPNRSVCPGPVRSLRALCRRPSVDDHAGSPLHRAAHAPRAAPAPAELAAGDVEHLDAVPAQERVGGDVALVGHHDAGRDGERVAAVVPLLALGGVHVLLGGEHPELAQAHRLGDRRVHALRRVVGDVQLLLVVAGPDRVGGQHAQARRTW